MSPALWAGAVVAGVMCLAVWVVLIAAARAAARGDEQIYRQSAAARREQPSIPEQAPSVPKGNRFARRTNARHVPLRARPEDSSERESGSSILR